MPFSWLGAREQRKAAEAQARAQLEAERMRLQAAKEAEERRERLWREGEARRLRLWQAGEQYRHESWEEAEARRLQYWGFGEAARRQAWEEAEARRRLAWQEAEAMRAANLAAAEDWRRAMLSEKVDRLTGAAQEVGAYVDPALQYGTSAIQSLVETGGGRDVLPATSAAKAGIQGLMSAYGFRPRSRTDQPNVAAGTTLGQPPRPTDEFEGEWGYYGEMGRKLGEASKRFEREREAIERRVKKGELTREAADALLSRLTVEEARVLQETKLQAEREGPMALLSAIQPFYQAQAAAQEAATAHAVGLASNVYGTSLGAAMNLYGEAAQGLSELATSPYVYQPTQFQTTAFEVMPFTPTGFQPVVFEPTLYSPGEPVLPSGQAHVPQYTYTGPSDLEVIAQAGRVLADIFNRPSNPQPQPVPTTAPVPATTSGGWTPQPLPQWSPPQLGYTQPQPGYTQPQLTRRF